MDSHLQRLQQAIADTTEGMTSEDLTRHPAGKWSATEVLEHLYLTYSGSVKGFERCLATGKPLARSPKFKDHLRRGVVIGLDICRANDRLRNIHVLEVWRLTL